MTRKIQSVVASVRKVRKGGGITKGHQKYFGYDIINVHYLDCGEDFMDKHTQQTTKYTLNIYN